uniref:Odorant receptor n=1 Tax=Pyrrhalta aenescens TaxID=281545 RepID=A0A1J0KKS5_9CUCU|nr:odorant receptor 15 [Pyrrhalta aenescens]
MADYYKDVKWCIKLCNFLGVNPFKENNIIQTLLITYFLVSLMGSIVTAVIFIFSNGDLSNIRYLIDVTNNMLKVPNGSFKLLTLLTKKSIIRDLMNETKNRFWESPETEGIKRSERFATFIKNFYFYCMLLCVLSSLIKPIIAGEILSTYNHYKPHSVPRYVFAIIGNTSSLISVMSMVGLDTLSFVLLMRVEVQFRTLNYHLERLFNFDKQNYVYSPANFSRKLKECVDHQNYLNQFVNRMITTFAAVTLVTFGLTTVSMSLRMYILSGDNRLNYKIEALFHLIAGINVIGVGYCIPSEAVMNQADKISESIYFSEWYNYPQEAKNVLQILQKETKPLRITAGGLFVVNLERFMIIEKTIISYCMFLRTMEVAG